MNSELVPKSNVAQSDYFFILDKDLKDYIFEKSKITDLYVRKTSRGMMLKINKTITIKNAVYCSISPFPSIIYAHQTFPNIGYYEIDMPDAHF